MKNLIDGFLKFQNEAFPQRTELFKHLATTQQPGTLFITCSDSRVVPELLTQQDKIANRAKDISGRMLGRRMEFPAEMRAGFMAYLKRCIDATAQAEKAIGELDELLETGFKGREVEMVAEMIHQLDLIVDDTDTMQIGLRQQLQAVEHKYNPIDVMFLYKILEWVGDLADQAERVGARLELMLARS